MQSAKLQLRSEPLTDEVNSVKLCRHVSIYDQGAVWRRSQCVRQSLCSFWAAAALALCCWLVSLCASRNDAVPPRTGLSYVIQRRGSAQRRRARLELSSLSSVLFGLGNSLRHTLTADRKSYAIFIIDSTHSDRQGASELAKRFEITAAAQTCSPASPRRGHRSRQALAVAALRARTPRQRAARPNR